MNDLFEMAVQDIFNMTGVGTVFTGKVTVGTIAVGDPVVCRTQSAVVPVRVIGVRDAAGKALARGEAGNTVGVVCNQIDLNSLAHAFAGEGDNRTVVGVTLATAPKKKHWWSS